MITSRQIKVLSTIIQLFGQIEEPVGSKRLLEHSDLSVSSATIRNDMVFLEKQGLLLKSHISSGRIPSIAGYQFYIQQLLDHLDVSAETQREQLLDELRNHSRLDALQMAKLSAELIVSQTKLPTFVLGQDHKKHQLQEIKLMLLDEQTIMAILITTTGEIENKVYSFHQSFDEETVETIQNIINEELNQLELQDAYQRMKLSIPLIIQKQLGFQIDFSNLIEKTYTQLRQQQFMLYGKEHVHRLIQEGMDGESIMALMTLMDGSHDLYDNFDGSEGIKVIFGHEFDTKHLNSINVVTGSYESEQKKISLGIIGPMTMAYQSNLSLLNRVMTHLSH